MSDGDDRAFEVLRRIMAAPEPNLWPLGTWLQHEETPEDRSALKGFDLSLGYPEGGQIPLILTGWEERSVWGFDRKMTPTLPSCGVMAARVSAPTFGFAVGGVLTVASSSLRQRACWPRRSPR